ncbi:hypothetical protein [Ralstonia solanacearum]|uniref:Uncharacterized protein n=2 Tax=Ralstonia solanacearum TaxID=305 RepID=D8P2W3_RALSL|nr:hypothetical protein [Ralstonia solanacearum]CBJ53249.1 protein of unknown function [Ralstonia solanacearum CFBP2957]
MNEPYLALYVKDGVLFFTKKLPKESEPREILEIGVDEVILDEFDEAAKKLGTTVLGILSLWHKDAFHGWGIPSQAGEDAAEDDFYIANRLISESVSKKTAVHVRSIDLLLQQAAGKSEDAKKFLEEDWPLVRARLESFGN